MPKKSFVVNTLTEARAATMTHMQILAHSRPLLKKMVKMVKDSEYSQNLSTGCRISTRAVRNLRNNRYPVVTSRIKFSDSQSTGQGKKLTLPCHHVIMLAKLRKKDKQAPLWSFADDDVVNHNCHESRCYKKSHLSITSTTDNNSKNIHCFGYAECSGCHVRICVCKHEPVCLPIVVSICTNCK